MTDSIQQRKPSSVLQCVTVKLVGQIVIHIAAEKATKTNHRHLCCLLLPCVYYSKISIRHLTSLEKDLTLLMRHASVCVGLCLYVCVVSVYKKCRVLQQDCSLHMRFSLRGLHLPLSFFLTGLTRCWTPPPHCLVQSVQLDH